MSGFQHITEKGGAVKENPLRYAAFTLWEKKNFKSFHKGEKCNNAVQCLLFAYKKSIKTKR